MLFLRRVISLFSCWTLLLFVHTWHHSSVLVQAWLMRWPSSSSRSPAMRNPPVKRHHRQQPQQQHQRYDPFSSVVLYSSSSSSSSRKSNDTDDAVAAASAASPPAATTAAKLDRPNLKEEEEEEEFDNGDQSALLQPNEEEKFAVADGANLETQPWNQQDDENDENDNKEDDLVATMKRLTSSSQSYADPLFWAEKAAEFVESNVEDVLKVPTTPFSSWAQTFVDGMTGTSSSSSPKKERLVVLGTGWGAVSLLQKINTQIYDVTVVSPRDHFCFTPFLATASCGSLQWQSICEPIREILETRQATFCQAAATDINPQEKTVTCRRVATATSTNLTSTGSRPGVDDDDDNVFTLEYDRLVVTVGAQTNTFGIPGIREHCYFLRQVEDARRIRSAIGRQFQKAQRILSGKDTPQQQKQQLLRQCLTFCIIGAGPTGIEFAAELRDLMEQDGPRLYPHLLKYVRIKVLSASTTVLKPFDKSLQDEAILQLTRAASFSSNDNIDLPTDFKLTELLLESSVVEVNDQRILLDDGLEVKYGMAVWAAGNGPLRLTLDLIDRLGAEQQQASPQARGRLAIDSWMRVLGSNGEILAVGDCTCVVDTTSEGELPATAQVASQQGEYLANLLNKKFDLSPALIGGILPPPKRDPARTETSLSDAIASLSLNDNSNDNTNEYAKPFRFWNLGMLAYTGGGSALAQIATALPADSDRKPLTGSGRLGNAVWRSVYLSKQLSIRNGLLVANDWTKRRLFGRDMNRL